MNISTVAERAATYSPVRAALTALAFPFYLAGMVAAVLWLAGAWIYAAAATGFADAKAKALPGEAP